MNIKTIMWLFFFVAFSVYVASELYFFGYYLVTKPEIYEAPTLRDFLYEATIILGFIGYFGYVFSIRILSNNFWKFYFVVTFSLVCLEIILGVISSGVEYFSAPVNPIWMVVFMIFVFIPFIIAMFRYSFMSKKIWE